MFLLIRTHRSSLLTLSGQGYRRLINLRYKQGITNFLCTFTA
jgi:hypothetical protein